MNRAQIDRALREAAALFAANRLDQAQGIAQLLAAAAPDDFHVQHLTAAIAARRGDWQGCVDAATRALALQPAHAEALANRGAALRMLGRPEEALADYDRALATAPDSADAHNNRGVALGALNRHPEAIEAYTRALALRPSYDRARFNRALSRLVTGDFEGGWADHEYRWTGSEMQPVPRAIPGRAWDGREDLRGKTILVYAEQGLGDAIQFSRYVPLLHRSGARVLLEVHAPLTRLLESVEGADHVIPTGSPLPPLDLHCALMSLPFALRTRADSIPAPIPYLEAATADIARWRERLRDAPGVRVGLAWSGSRTLRNDANRSMALDRLAPLAAPGRTLIAVQKDIRDADRAALSAMGVRSFGEELTDFADTAALMESLDVIVSVDSSPAHLAGALGKPVWVLLPFSPDWRWMLDREDNPWYPTARLFRQSRIGDWDGVIRRVAEALGRL